MDQADGCTTTKNASRLSVLSLEDTRGATSMKRLDMHYWRAGYSESCTVSSVGGRRKRAKQLVPRRRPTQLNKQGNFRPKGEGKFRSLSTAAPEVGSAWCGVVDCFSGETSRLQCTLLARWDKGYEEVWLIVTDLEPAQATAVWYGMRSWIEGGVKDRSEERRVGKECRS